MRNTSSQKPATIAAEHNHRWWDADRNRWHTDRDWDDHDHDHDYDHPPHSN